MLSTVLCIFSLYLSVFTEFTLNFHSSVLVLWILFVFMAYDILLWSELLSSSVIHQSVILRSTLLVASVKSVLLLRIRFLKFVIVLGSFTISSILLIMYSCICFPLLFVVVSCHVVDLALLSIAMMNPSLILCFSILSTLLRSFSMVFCLSQYMLANISVVSPLVVYSVMVSSSEIFYINITPNALFHIVIALLYCATPAVYDLYLKSNLGALP